MEVAAGHFCIARAALEASFCVPRPRRGARCDADTTPRVLLRGTAEAAPRSAVVGELSGSIIALEPRTSRSGGL